MAQVIEWSCTPNGGTKETFRTKKAMVDYMMSHRMAKTPIRKDGRDYYYQQAK